MSLTKSEPFAFTGYKEKFISFLDKFILILLGINFLFAEYIYDFAWIALIILIPVIILRLALNRNVYLPDKTFFILLAAFLIIQVISSFFAADTGASLFVVRRRAMLYIPFFASTMFIKNLKQLKIILLCFICFTALVSVLEIFRYITDPHRLTAPVNEFRIAYFGHPVTIAEIKMLALILITVFVLSREKFLLNKVWLLILSLPILFTFYITGSRGAMFGFFVSLVLIGFIRSRVFVISFVSAVTLFLLLSPAQFSDRMLSVTDLSDRAIASRYEMWHTSVQILKDYPVTGTGSGDLVDIYKRYTPIRYDGEGTQMHNNFLQLLVTNGVLGLAAWLAFMIFILIRYLRIYHNTGGDNKLNDLVLISIAGMIAFQVSGLTDWNYGDFTFSFVLWMFLSFAFLAEKFAIREEKNLPQS